MAKISKKQPVTFLKLQKNQTANVNITSAVRSRPNILSLHEENRILKKDLERANKVIDHQHRLIDILKIERNLEII